MDRFPSLKGRLAIALVSTALLPWLGYAIYTGHQSQRQAQQQQHVRLQHEARQAAQRLTLFLDAYQPTGQRQNLSLQDLPPTAGVERSRVDANGVIVASTDTALLGQQTALGTSTQAGWVTIRPSNARTAWHIATETLVQLLDTSLGFMAVLDAEGGVIAATPTWPEGYERLPHHQITLSQVPWSVVYGELPLSRPQPGGGAVLALLLGGGTAIWGWRFCQGWTRSLTELDTAFADFIRGDHKRRARVWKGSEAAPLAERFNIMAEQLTELLEQLARHTVDLQTEIQGRQHIEAELQLHRESLEQTVQQRTAALAKANACLENEIRDRRQIEQVLFREVELAQVTLQSIVDGVIVVNTKGYVQYLNQAASRLTGWQPTQAQKKPLNAILYLLDEGSRQRDTRLLHHVLSEGKVISLTNHPLILISRLGQRYAVDYSAAPLRSTDKTIIGAVLVLHDVTSARRMARRLMWQASHDALTRLINRSEFERRLELTVQLARSHGQSHALCYIDLDQFKIVNDNCGHLAGDELLRQVSDLMRQQVKTTDTVARLGGDEFGLILMNVSAAEAWQASDRLRRAMERFRFYWENKSFTVGVSIGLVPITIESLGPAQLLNAADSSCYAAKALGRNRIHTYSADDTELAKQYGAAHWVARITEALESNRFQLYFQPIVPTIANKSPSLPLEPFHCEILLRLQDESGVIVSPSAFIPAAERYDLMRRLDRWVIQKLFSGLAEAARSKEIFVPLDQPIANVVWAVNLSGLSLNDEGFLGFLAEQFRCYDIPHRRICFEITETVAIANLTRAARVIGQLREWGCLLALDDFGSGMSSFAYLKHLPVDYLKIDGHFIRHIASNPIDRAIVDSVQRLSQVMGLKTIAEFVEDDAVRSYLAHIGVDYVQGYGIAEPMPLFRPSTAIAIR